MDEQLTDAQVDKLGDALDTFIEAQAEADVAAKIALTYCCITESAPSDEMLEEFKKALNFYQTPQLAKIVDA